MSDDPSEDLPASPGPADDFPALRRHSVLLVYMTSLLQGAMGVLLPASSAFLRQRLDLSDTLYGALFLPGFAGAVVTSLSGHALLRRWSLKSLFLFALISQVLMLVLMAIGGSLGRQHGLPILILGLIVSGPAGGAIGITLNTAAIELFPRSRSGSLSILHGVLGAGATLGPLLVAGCLTLGIWAAAPLLASVALVGVTVLAGRRPIQGLPDSIVETHARSQIPRRLLLRSLSVFLYGAGEATFTAWAVLFLRETKGLPLGAGAGALSAFWLAMTAGRISTVAVLRVIGPLKAAVLLTLGMALSFLLVAHCHGPVDSALRFAFAGLCCSALFPLLLGLASSEFPDRTPQVSAVFSAAVMIGLAVGSFGVGALRATVGLERIYQFAAITPMAVCLLLVGLKLRGR